MILLNISLEEINYFFKCLSFFKENSDFFLFCGTLSSIAVVLFNNRKTNILSQEYKIRDVKLANDFKDREENLAKELKERDANLLKDLQVSNRDLKITEIIIDKRIKAHENTFDLIKIMKFSKLIFENNTTVYTPYMFCSQENMMEWSNLITKIASENNLWLSRDTLKELIFINEYKKLVLKIIKTGLVDSEQKLNKLVNFLKNDFQILVNSLENSIITFLKEWDVIYIPNNKNIINEPPGKKRMDKLKIKKDYKKILKLLSL